MSTKTSSFPCSDLPTSNVFRVLCVGDVVARPGREAVTELLPRIKKERGVDFIVVNGENSAGGSGIDKKCLKQIRAAGADVVTLGDHTWRRPEVRTILESASSHCICPGNYPAKELVRGWGVYEVGETRIGVLNVLGRTFLNQALDCPFRYAEEVLLSEYRKCDIRIVDFHGEATSEKIAFAKYFQKEFSLVFGTHTHVPTGDATILGGQTAYVTDLGMTGSSEGVIGMDKDAAIARFLTGMPSAYKAAKGSAVLNGIVVDFCRDSFLPVGIESISVSAECES